MTSEPDRPTPPEPAKPLSEQEREAIARLEASLREESPAASVPVPDRPPPHDARGRTRIRVRDLVVRVVVVTALAVLLMPSAWLAGLLVAIVMIGPVGVALWAMRRGVL